MYFLLVSYFLCVSLNFVWDYGLKVVGQSTIVRLGQLWKLKWYVKLYLGLSDPSSIEACDEQSGEQSGAQRSVRGGGADSQRKMEGVEQEAGAARPGAHDAPDAVAARYLRRSSFGGLLRERSLGRSLLLVRPCDMSVELHAAMRDLATCGAVRARRDHAMPCAPCSSQHAMPCAPGALRDLFDLCEA